MLKKEFIEKLSENSGFSKDNCNVFLNAFIKSVEEALVANEKVQFVGFGTFDVAERAARECRNPKTGEIIHVEASKKVRFKAGSTLKELVK